MGMMDTPESIDTRHHGSFGLGGGVLVSRLRQRRGEFISTQCHPDDRRAQHHFYR